VTPFFATLTLDLILISPFIGAVCVVIWGIRALVKGEVESYGRVVGRRTIVRSVNPIQFWVELSLYGVTTVAFLTLGFMFFNDASRFFYELVRDILGR
jgi:hypothetical protein